MRITNDHIVEHLGAKLHHICTDGERLQRVPRTADVPDSNDPDRE